MGRYEYYFIKLNDEFTTETVMDRFGQYLEITIDYMGMDPDDAVDAFVLSELARQFELQSSPFVFGKSGTELVQWALEHSGRIDLVDSVPLDATVGLASIPYWIGQMVAYFQIMGGMTYWRIFRCIPYARLRELYFAYQECLPEEFMPVLQRIAEEQPWESELKIRRKAWHMTQSELADRSGVSLRAIQQYEQGVKDIRKAAADAVYRLSVVLRCSMEELIE